MIRVMIADDQQLIRQSLRIVLEKESDQIRVCGVAGNGREVIETLDQTKPDVILMDIRMPVLDGVQCTKKVKETHPEIRIIILTTFDDDELVSQALKEGAKGYFIKNHKPEDLKQMIRSIHHGAKVMDEKVFDKFVDAGINPNSNFDKEKYTAREIEIIEAVASGLSNKEISEKLFISEGTVKNYISNILLKEGLSHRTQLAVYYLTGRKGN